MSGVDVFEDFGDNFQLRKKLVVQLFFAGADGFDGHAEAVLLVEHGDDFGDGSASERVEMALVEVAVPFGEDFLPSDIVEGHGIDDGAVAVEEIGVVRAGRELEFHSEEDSSLLSRRIFYGCRRVRGKRAYWQAGHVK